RSYSAPNNCTLVLVGDFAAAEALKWIEKLYGPIPAGGPLPAVPTGEPQQKGERRAMIRYPSQAPAVLAGFRGPDGRDPDSLVLDLLEAALSSGEGARPRRALLDLPDRYAALTASDLQRVARQTFAQHRRNVVTLVPGEIS